MNLESFDLIVLGAGPVGMTLASNSADEKIRIAVIDTPDLNISNGFRGSNKPDLKVESLVGGSARYWGGQIAYFSHRDLAKALALADFSIESIDFIVNEMRALADQLSLPFDSDNVYSNYFSEDRMLNSRQVYSTYTASLDISKLLGVDSLMQKRKFSLLNGKVKELQILNGLCNGLVLDDDSFVEVLPRQTVCIALGGLGSTELIMRTFPEQARKEIRPLVDHPHGYVAAFRSKKGGIFHRRTTLKIGSHVFKRKIELKSEKTDSSGIAELHYDYFGTFFPEILCVQLSRREKLVLQLNRLFLKFLRLPIALPSLVWVWIQIEQFPDPQNTPKLGEDGRFEVSMKIGPKDLLVIEEFQSRLVSEISKDGFELAWIATRDEIASTFTGAYHPSGSFPMNSNPKRSLVAPFGRFHNIDNLFIASSASWTHAGWVNPTFMLMVFARLVYREIQSYLKK